MIDIEIENPKRTNLEKSGIHSWHPYYAGFSESFVDSLLGKVPANGIVFDPWAGSGTTKIACDKRGYRSLMSDINPAMVAYASSKDIRVTDNAKKLREDFNFLMTYLCFSTDYQVSADDPLKDYLPTSMIRLSRLYFEALDMIKFPIVEMSSFDKVLCVDQKSLVANPYESFLRVVFIKTIKELINPRLISKNPTWTKKIEAKPKILLASVLEKLEFNFENMLQQLSESFSGAITSDSLSFVGNSRDIKIETSSIDCIITSPPYLTRIDYAVSTKLENLLMDNCRKHFRSLREDTIGTTVISKKLIQDKVFFGTTCDSTLNRIYNHGSYASKSYYYPNIYQYFTSLKQSIDELVRVVKESGEIFLVVQNSFYKEINLNISQIIIEMASDAGAKGEIVKCFPVKRNLGAVNAKSIRTEDHYLQEDVISIKKIARN